MPFKKELWAMPKSGDLVYGVNSSNGRKYYLKYSSAFKKAGVFTVDELQVLETEGSKTRNQSFLDAVAIHKKYKSALNTGDTNEAVRRKCKAGLEWGISQKKQIHFVLDDLDLAAVVGKNYAGEGNKDKPATATEPKNRSITGSELRWIYRNRHLAEVQAHVQFWVLGEQCLPPWEADLESNLNNALITFPKNLWAGYVPKGTVM